MTGPGRGTAEYYDRDYFETEGVRGAYHDFDQTIGFYRQYAELIDMVFGLNGLTLLDVGCAKGISLKAYLERGVEVWGTDISFYLEEACPEEVRGRVWQGDLGRPFDEWISRRPSDAPERYDLLTCVETIEHVFPWRVPLAIANLCRVAKRWLYLTIPAGTTWDKNDEHVCIRPREWWCERFMRFYPALLRREDVEGWARRARIADGFIPFDVWHWWPLVYEVRGASPASAIVAAEREYRAGEALHRHGKASFSGHEADE